MKKALQRKSLLLKTLADVKKNVQDFCIFNLKPNCMFQKKQLTVVLGLSLMVIVGIAASRPPQEQPKRNLKVLPKNLTHEQLDAVMDEWKSALGVKCNFCHASRADDPRKLDFASDAKPEKQMARNMYKMTGKINKKFFKFKAGKDTDGKDMVAPISCKTCHHGTPHPENK